jgi:hypothetical protein
MATPVKPAAGPTTSSEPKQSTSGAQDSAAGFYQRDVEKSTKSGNYTRKLTFFINFFLNSYYSI